MTALPRPLATRAFAAVLGLSVPAAVPPGEDFFAHANGAGLKATEIPVRVCSGRKP